MKLNAEESIQLIKELMNPSEEARRAREQYFEYLNSNVILTQVDGGFDIEIKEDKTNMTVEELISVLREMPRNAVVAVMDSEGLYHNIGLDDICHSDKVVWLG